MTRPGINSSNAVWLKQAKLRGEGYTVSTQKSVSAGGTLNVHLKNPSDTSKLTHLFDVIGGTQFEGTLTLYDDFSSAPSGGSDLVIDNLRMDTGGNGPDEGNMVATQDVTYTENEAHFETVLSGGGSGGNQIGGTLMSTLPIIEPGTNIYYDLESQADANDILVQFIASERP